MNPQHMSPSNEQSYEALPPISLRGHYLSTPQSQLLGQTNQRQINFEDTNNQQYSSEFQSQQLPITDTGQNGQQLVNFTDKIKNLFFKVKFQRWVSRIVSSTRSRMFKTISLNQLNMIGDKAYNSMNHARFQSSESLRNNKKGGADSRSYYKKQDLLGILIARIDSRFPVLSPKHRVKVASDFIMNMTLLIIFFVLSIALSFQVHIDKIFPTEGIYIGLAIMLFNSILVLNTGFQRLGVLVISRQAIFKAYFSTNLISDVVGFLSIVAIILLDQQLGNGNQDNQDDSDVLFASIKLLWFLPFLLKLRDIRTYMQQFEDRIIFKQRTKHVIKIIRLFSTIILINHLMACAWIFNSKIPSHREVNWITGFNAQDETWFYQYILAFYFSTVTMTSVGYGDVTARNLSEFILAIFMMLISSGVFGFTLNQIGNIFTEFYSDENEIKNKLDIINQHMDNKNVSHSLRRSVREYLEYIWRENNEKFQNDSLAIVSQLNEDLKRELYLHQNKQIIDYLRTFFSEGLISKAILAIKEQQIKPQQVIQAQGSLEEIGLYLVEKGKVEIYLDCYNPHSNTSTTRQIHVIQEGQVFGMMEFFSGERCNLNVKAVGFVNILKLSRADFIEILSDFRSDQETFLYMKDKQIFNNESKKINTGCYSCGSTDHQFSQCNYLHLIFDKHHIISKQNYGSYCTETQRNAQWQQLQQQSSSPTHSPTRKQFLSKQTTSSTNRSSRRTNFCIVDIDDPRFEEFTYTYYEALQEYELAYLSYDFEHNYINDVYPSDDDDDDQEASGNMNTNYNYGTPVFSAAQFDPSTIPVIDNELFSPPFISNRLPPMTTSITPILGAMPNLQNSSILPQPQQQQLQLQSKFLEVIPEIQDSMQSGWKKQESIQLDRIPTISAENNSSSLPNNSSSNNNNTNSNTNNVHHHTFHNNAIATNSNSNNRSFTQVIPQHSDVSPVKISERRSSLRTRLNQFTVIKAGGGNEANNMTASMDVRMGQRKQFLRKAKHSNSNPHRPPYGSSSNSMYISSNARDHLNQIRELSESHMDRQLHLQHMQQQQQHSSQQTLSTSSMIPPTQSNFLLTSMQRFQQQIMQNINQITQNAMLAQQNPRNQNSHSSKTVITQQQNEVQSMQEIFRNFDKLKNFTIYFPLNNFTFVLFNRQSKKFMSQHQYLHFIQTTGKSRNTNNPLTSSTSHQHVLKTKLELLKNKTSIAKRPGTTKNIAASTNFFDGLASGSSTSQFISNHPSFFPHQTPPPPLLSLPRKQSSVAVIRGNSKRNLSIEPISPQGNNYSLTYQQDTEKQSSPMKAPEYLPTDKNYNDYMNTAAAAAAAVAFSIRSPNNVSISHIHPTSGRFIDHTSVSEQSEQQPSSQTTTNNQNDSYYIHSAAAIVKEESEGDEPKIETIMQSLKIGRNNEYFLDE